MSEHPTIDSKVVDRTLRDVLWRPLKDRGFERRTGRTAWRDRPQCVQTVNVQSFNRYLADRMGATTISFAVNLGVFYPIVAEHAIFQSGVKDLSRPAEHHCQARFHLAKGLSQPGPERPQPPPAVGRPPDPRHWVDRPDVWYVAGDGSNLEEVVADAQVRVLDVGLSWLERLSDLREARRAFLETPSTNHAPGIVAEGYGGAIDSPNRWYAVAALSLALGETDDATAAVDKMAGQSYYQERPDQLAGLRRAVTSDAAEAAPIDSQE